MSAPLIVAVPAKGRLQENAEAFFARAGIPLVKPRGARDYRGTVTGLPNVEVAYLSAAEGVWDSVDHPAAKVAVLPLALVGAVIDLAAWVCSAPFAYPAGAIGAIDDDPVTEEVEGLDSAPLPGGTPVTVAATGVAAAPLTVTTDAAGRITADLDAMATAALEAGRETAMVELRAGGGAVAVEVAAVTRGPLVAPLSTTGVVEAPIVEVSFDQAGRVETLRVEEGDRVRAGQVLATLAAETQRAGAAQTAAAARAAANQARAA